jgi:tetratricopeptide (TPR) repeat protein
VSRIEAGARVPSLQILAEFGRRLGVSAPYLATGADELDLGLGPTGLLEAELAARTGDVDGARALYEEALTGTVAPGLAAAATGGLGQLLFRQGDHGAAIPLLEEALASPDLSDRDAGFAADSLGRSYALLARFEEALALFERFLLRAEERGDVHEITRFSVLLANTLIDRGNFGRAEEILAGVMDQARESLDPVARGGMYWSQSRLHLSQGRPDVAAQYARLALGTFEATEHTLFVAKAFALIAKIENDRGRAEEALALIAEGLPAIVASGNKYEEALFLLERARALAQMGHLEEAASLALGTLSAFQLASQTNAARGYSVAASVFVRLGDHEKALELYELAVELMPAADQPLIEVYSAMAEVLEKLGRKDEAYEILKRAMHSRVRA